MTAITDTEHDAHTIDMLTQLAGDADTTQHLSKLPNDLARVTRHHAVHQLVLDAAFDDDVEL